MTSTEQTKLARVRGILRKMGSVLVAYSGGVDSTLLLRLAHEELADRAVALLASSPTYPAVEIREAKKLAEKMGVQVIEIFTREMENPEFTANTPRRCYHCKKELFEFCRKEAEDRGLKYVVDGSNVDDTGDFRPGMEAAKQLMVHSPLKEAGLTKAEIRDISREFGLSTWDKPSLACLSSRFPYGTKLTPERIAKVEKAEDVLHRLGFRQIRVRYHGDLARLEVEPQEIGRFIDPELRGKVVVDLKGIGFIYVTLDLQGYRTGAMNESLKSGSTEGFQ